jgi:hypothetical protein
MLQFLGDVGVYIPSLDAIKFTAIRDGYAVGCYARRSALIAVGCHPFDDAAALCAAFEEHRQVFERAAAAKHSHAMGDIMLGVP